MKVLIRTLLRYLLIVIFQIMRWLPFRFGRALAAGVMTVISWMLPGQRRTAMTNLKQAYPAETPDKFFSSTVAQCFSHLGQTVAEMFHFCHDSQDMVSRVSIEGLEHLDAALARGKGVVAVTAHLGNFPLMVSVLARRGHLTRVILKPPRDAKLTDYFLHRWEQLSHARVIYSMPRIACIHQALKTLRQNGLLFILPDQNFGDDGRVFVRFFGRPAATGTGPLVFARRSGAPIVPMFITRNPDGSHVITIDPPMDLSESSADQSIELMQTQAFTSVIEKHIRRSPDQWLWFHKRWKTQLQDGDVVIDR